jgi:hypothetical protein
MRLADRFIAGLKPGLSIVTLVVMLVFSPSGIVKAIAVEQERIYDNSVDWLVYQESKYTPCSIDTAADGGNATGGTANAETDNAKTAYNYFVKQGLSPFRAAAIVGNLAWESSGVNPRINEGGGGPGRGIAQWSVNGRWKSLQQWATENGNLDIYNIQTQLDFIWYEMNGTAYSSALRSVQAAADINAATRAFMVDYEQPGSPHLSDRIALANDALKLYGGGAASSGTPISTPTRDSEAADAATAASQFVCGSTGNGVFTGQPGQTVKRGKGFSLQNNTDYTSIPCPTGSKLKQVYTHPTEGFRINVCVINGGSLDFNSVVGDRVIQLVADAKKAGFDFSDSGGWRSYEEQWALRRQNCPNAASSPSGGCSPPTALPGNSEHERGLAIDMRVNGGTVQSGSGAFNWLVANAAKYGYYNLPSESWHWSTSGN